MISNISRSAGYETDLMNYRPYSDKILIVVMFQNFLTMPLSNDKQHFKICCERINGYETDVNELPDPIRTIGSHSNHF